MARTEAARFEHGSESFPILHDNGRIRVYKNPCGEVFVKDIRSGATMRINSYGYGRGGLSFTTDGRVEPIRVTNTIGWLVEPR